MHYAVGASHHETTNAPGLLSASGAFVVLCLALVSTDSLRSEQCRLGFPLVPHSILGGLEQCQEKQEANGANNTSLDAVPNSLLPTQVCSPMSFQRISLFPCQPCLLLLVSPLCHMATRTDYICIHYTIRTIITTLHVPCLPITFSSSRMFLVVRSVYSDSYDEW